MRSARATVAPNTVTTLLTPPPGKKYEILTVSVSDFFGLGSKWYPVATVPGPTFFLLDEIALAAGVLAAGRAYGGIEIDHGLSFDYLMLVTGSPAAAIYVSYMDVDL